MQKTEVWKDVKKFEGLYQISNFGRVKSLDRLNFKGHKAKGLILKINKNTKNRYYSICLTKFGKKTTHRIHVLVAQSFLNHKNDGTQIVVVDHIDEDKTNNNLSNLQLISQRENNCRSIKKSTSKYSGVSWSSHAKKWRSVISLDGKYIHLGYFKCELSAAKAYLDKLKNYGISK